VDQAHEHIRALRKLSRLFAVECKLNLARHNHVGRGKSGDAGER
jgi:hypothetical protein